MEESADRRWIILAVFAAVVVAVVAAILIGQNSGGGGDESKSSVAGCKVVEEPQPKNVSLKAPKQTVKAGEGLTAAVTTSCGDFSIALDSERAPKTVNSFVYLSEEGFYDGLPFHRIIPEFDVQGGDPQGTGSGGPGYSVDEKPPSNLAYTKGVVAMAKTEVEPPGRSGSQFFVVVGADAGLPPEYALVGKVSEGMDVVERISELGSQAGTPKETVVIESISIERS
jgi:cyclophilin family peptidyl-prolyl cis-trans isomerase